MTRLPAIRSSLHGLLLALGVTGCAAKSVAKPVSPALPALVLGDFTDDYDIRYTITPALWTQLPRARYHVLETNADAGYLIARNDSANPSDGGRFTRIDWVPLSGMAPYTWAFCLTAYKAPTADSARRVTTTNRETPRTGCNGFPFSRMRARP